MASTYIPLGPLKDWNNPPNPVGSVTYDWTAPVVPGVQIFTTSAKPFDLTYVDTHTSVLHQRFPVNRQGSSQRSFTKPTFKVSCGLYAADGRSDAEAWGDVEAELNFMFAALDGNQEAILRVSAAGYIPPTVLYVSAQASFQGFTVQVDEGDSRHTDIMLEFAIESPFAP